MAVTDNSITIQSAFRLQERSGGFREETEEQVDEGKNKEVGVEKVALAKQWDNAHVQGRFAGEYENFDDFDNELEYESDQLIKSKFFSPNIKILGNNN